MIPAAMRVSLLTREFPPEVYGGAGVHVEHLAAALAQIEDLDVSVQCYGAPRESELVAAAYRPWSQLPPGVLGNLSVNLAMAAGAGDVGADLVHSHTWYANMGGHLAKLLHGVPHVMTSHSLEPRRPWKADQLGSGYRVSAWCERTAIESADAVVAVSAGMRADVLQTYPMVDPDRVVVIHNGIDAEVYRPDHMPAGHGVDPDRPAVVFVGRLTPQKGVLELLEAADRLDPRAQLVLCAGPPDTAAFVDQVQARIAALNRPDNVVWIEGMLDRAEVVRILTAATVFVCPSLYEPFGLVNLEAMACETAVVASAVGGIPEVVADGETGFLVATGPRFVHDLADRINALLTETDLARRLGQAGRDRVLERFSWTAIAAETAALYRRITQT